jgi:hypothetical protein
MPIIEKGMLMIINRAHWLSLVILVSSSGCYRAPNSDARGQEPSSESNQLEAREPSVDAAPPARQWTSLNEREEIDISSIYYRGSLATFKTRSIPDKRGHYIMHEVVADCISRNETVLYIYFNLGDEQTYGDRWDRDPEWFTWYTTIDGQSFPALDDETYEIVCRK